MKTSQNQISFLFAISLLIPLWNIPHTILFRYLFALVLLIIVFLSKPDWKTYFKSHKLLFILFTYLFIQLLFFSTDYYLAFKNFKSEWLKFILFGFLGIGCGYFLSKIKFPRLFFYFGVLFSIPLLVHLFLSLIKATSLGYIPIGYWGINESHGDLGYSSIHAVIFLSVFLFFQANSNKEKITTSLLLIACLSSLLIASSRGGIVFLLGSFCLVLLTKLFALQAKKPSFKILLTAVFGVSFLVVGIFQVGSTLDSARWNGSFSNLEITLKGDALKINCEGIDYLKNVLGHEGIEISPQIVKTLDSINGFDYARIVVARSALQLALLNPMGINQSKLAYDIALEKYCGGKPQIELLNSHNGWLDTSLAIGILGALLYFLVLCGFIYEGLKSIKINSAYGVALLSLALIWIIRSLFDSSQRDQMLEMQIFTLCLISSLILYFKNFEINDN